MGISVVGVRGLWWMTRLFAQTSGGAIRGVYRGFAIGVSWVCRHGEQREIVIVGRSSVLGRHWHWLALHQAAGSERE